jgi:hypothetical protein
MVSTKFLYDKIHSLEKIDKFDLAWGKAEIIWGQ